MYGKHGYRVVQNLWGFVVDELHMKRLPQRFRNNVVVMLNAWCSSVTKSWGVGSNITHVFQSLMIKESMNFWVIPLNAPNFTKLRLVIRGQFPNLLLGSTCYRVF